MNTMLPILRVVLLAALLWAGAAMPSPGLAQETAPPAPAEGGVVLLNNDQVLQGRVSRQDEWYHVELPAGMIRVRQAEVRLVCQSLEECYTRMRATTLANDAYGHVHLGQWCFRQGLIDLARRELAAARALEPGLPMVGILAREIEIHDQQQQRRAAGDVPRPPAPPHADREFDRIAQSLPGPLLEDFTQRVQPLLVNSCATSNCHGLQSPSQFKLLRTPEGRPPTQRVTQRNLAAVLECIDRAQPAASPLLNVPLSPHGGTKAPLFTEREIDQYRRIVDWVYDVAWTPSPTADRPHQSQPLLGLARPAPGMWPESAPLPSGGDGVMTAGFEFATPPSGNPQPTGEATAATFLQEDPAQAAPTRSPPARSEPQRGAKLPVHEPRDPFDAEVFNRRHFGADPADTPPAAPAAQ